MVGTGAHAYKLKACIEFAHANWNTSVPKTRALQHVLLLYRYNVYRVRLAMLTPANIASLAADIQRWLDIAEYELKGSLDQPLTKEEYEKITIRMTEISQEKMRDESKMLGTDQWDAHARQRLEEGSLPVDIISTSQATHGGIEAMLASFITGAWTAFEALAADLWETALNTHPQKLAELSGKTSRLRKTSQPTRPASKDDSERSIPLSFIQRHNFQISDKMGTLLKPKVEFARLAGIRAAYVQAFSEDYAQIDSIIADDCLDALSVVRNLLVHKAGLADDEYVRRAQNLSVPKLKVGTLIRLDGDTAVSLIKPVFDIGKKLVAAVDSWLEKHK
jgi:hypothetical protein